MAEVNLLVDNSQSFEGGGRLTVFALHAETLQMRSLESERNIKEDILKDQF